MSSDHYHTHKDVLCWDCNNLIKKIYETLLQFGGKFERKSGLFTFEKMLIVAASLMRIIPVMIRQLKINLQLKSDPLIYRKLTKSAKNSKYPIYLLASPLALRPLARVPSTQTRSSLSLCLSQSVAVSDMLSVTQHRLADCDGAIPALFTNVHLQYSHKSLTFLTQIVTSAACIDLKLLSRCQSVKCASILAGIDMQHGQLQFTW